MAKILAVCAAPLLLLALSESAGRAEGRAFQDEVPVELKWDLKKDDRLDFKWSYNDFNRHEMPKLEGRTDENIFETYDRREIEAELYVKEDTPAGTVLMTLKKVGWSQGTHEFDCTLTWMEGRKVDVKTIVKVKDKASSLVKREEFAKSTANTTAEGMKKLIEGTYTLSATTGRPGETLVLRNNQVARAGNSLFDRIYLHSVAPRGSVSLNQAWKDPLEGVQLPPGLVEVDTLSWKIMACGPKTGATAKAAFTFPINKVNANASNNQVTNVKTAGSYTLAREYTFSVEGFLSGSKEAISFDKKTDASGKDADFYKDTAKRTLAQAVSVKMKKKPDEKKTEEKKAEEKK